MEQHEPLSNKEKINIFLPIIVAISLAAGTWLGFVMSSRANDPFVVVSDSKKKYSGSRGKFGEIMRFIDARYLVDKDLNELEEAAINTILKDLDPHSRYISLSEIQRVKESLSGNFDGIGVEFYILKDTIYIVNVIEDGPSEEAGIKDGDKIVMINDTLVAGEDVYTSDVMDKLKGKSGSKVKVSVKRRGLDGLKDITITRGKIPVNSVDVAYMLNKETGFIKINRFSGTTFEETMKAIDRLTKEGMQHLILDLRHNPGGYLDAAVRILDQVFKNRKLLVYTEGRSYKRKEYNSTGKSQFDISKVVVLIDESSASASEIMAGAIQDNDRGLVIGRRSFGKGLVQEQYELSDGSALRLTVAKYFTPSGRYIQKSYDKGADNYNSDIQARYNHGELYYRDSIVIDDSTEYRTSSGRIVYGGGGIIPDIFVPLDTLYRNSYYLSLTAFVPSFVYNYTDWYRHRMLEEYPTFEDFERNFVVSDDILENFIQHTESKDIERNEELLKVCKDRIRLLIKAYLARQLYEEEKHFQLLHQEDEMVQRAIEEINRNGQSHANNE